MYYCLFEQSGTFKNEIKKLGGVAKDFDIQNDYGETDIIIDLYDEIERGYLELNSIFDGMTPADYIIAFFPCTRFEAQINMAMLGNQYQQEKWDDYKKLNYDLYLHKQMSNNYELITKLVLICIRKNIPLVIENPSSPLHYLTRNWALKPKVIDLDRRANGDYYKKPTQYWFINCEPKNNLVFESIDWCEYRKTTDNRSDIKKRSEIHPQYANRFIRQYIADYVDGEWVL